MPGGGTRTRLQPASTRSRLRPTSPLPVATTQADTPRRHMRLMHPCMPLLAFLCKCSRLARTICRNSVGMRGPSSACGMRRFQRVQMWCDGYPAAQAGRPPDARVRHSSCERLEPFGQNKASPKIDMGGGPGLVFLYFLFFLTSRSLKSSALTGDSVFLQARGGTQDCAACARVLEAPWRLCCDRAGNFCVCKPLVH